MDENTKSEEEVIETPEETTDEVVDTDEDVADEPDDFSGASEVGDR
jgi:hypothetical protein